MPRAAQSRFSFLLVPPSTFNDSVVLSPSLPTLFPSFLIFFLPYIIFLLIFFFFLSPLFFPLLSSLSFYLHVRSPHFSYLSRLPFSISSVHLHSSLSPLFPFLLSLSPLFLFTSFPLLFIPPLPFSIPSFPPLSLSNPVSLHPFSHSLLLPLRSFLSFLLSLSPLSSPFSTRRTLYAHRPRLLTLTHPWK